MMWAPGCRTGGRLVLERFHFSMQLTLSLEGGAKILAALAAQRGIFLLPSAPAAAPGARGLRLGVGSAACWRGLDPSASPRSCRGEGWRGRAALFRTPL